MTIMTPGMFGEWHQGVAQSVARDPYTRETKRKKFPNDITGRAVYQMHQELGKMDDGVPGMARFAFGQITACAAGVWLHEHGNQVPNDFPIPLDDMITYYTMYEGILNDVRSLSARRDSLGNVTYMSLWEGLLELQNDALAKDQAAKRSYLAGYNVALQRWRNLTTQA